MSTPQNTELGSELSDISSTNTMLIITPCNMNCSSSAGNVGLASTIEDNSYYRWTKVTIALIITVVILASNTINLMALYRMREIGMRMKILLMSLSTSDLCLGLFVCMPAVVSGILSRWPFGPVMCQITGIMNGVAISVSLWSLMAIGVERFLVMRKPRVSKFKKNSSIVAGCVTFIWMFNTLFFALPIAWEHDYLYYTYDPDVMTCSFMWKHTWHFLAAKILYPVLSGTVIVFTSWQVNQILKEAERARKQWIINPVSRVGMPTDESKDALSKREPEPRREQRKCSEAPMKYLTCHPPGIMSETFTPRTDQARLLVPHSPLLMRDTTGKSSPTILAKSPFPDSYIFNNRHEHLNVPENEQLEPKSCESNPNLNCNGTILKTGHCIPDMFQDLKDMTSPLSQSDLTFHLQNPENRNSEATTIDQSKITSKENSNISCHSDKLGILQHNQQAEGLSSVSPTADAIDGRTDAKSKPTFFSFKLHRKKKIWKKEVTFQGSVGLKSDRQMSRPLEVPLSKSFLNRQRKAKVLLLCTTTVFFIAISPYSISSLLEHFKPNLNLPSWLRFLALWTLCTNCLLNVFIYSAVYREFRSHCKNILRTVACQAYKTKEHIVSVPTSSMHELCAVKGKGKKHASAQSCNTESNIGHRNPACDVSTHSHISLSPSNTNVPDIREVSASPFEERSPKKSLNNPQCLQPPPVTTQVIHRKDSNPFKSQRRNTIHILPVGPPRQTLQPRDDAGIISAYTLNSSRLVSGSSTNPSTPCSVGISPSVSQSSRSSCSLEFFGVETMPSVDV